MLGRGGGVGIGTAQGWTSGRGAGEADGLAVGVGEDVAVPPPTDAGAVADGRTQRRPDREADGRGATWAPPVEVLGGALVLGCASSDGWCDGFIRVSSRNAPCVRGKVGLTCTISTANPSTPTTRQAEPTTCQPSNPCKRIQRQKRCPSRACTSRSPLPLMSEGLFLAQTARKTDFGPSRRSAAMPMVGASLDHPWLWGYTLASDAVGPQRRRWDVAKAKRVAAPVKTSSVPSKVGKAVPRTSRASIELGQRDHAGVKSAAPRAKRLRGQSVTHSAALARD